MVGEADIARIMRAFMDVPALVAIVRGPEHVYAFANHAYVRSARIGDDFVGRPFGVGARAIGMERLIALLDEVRATGVAKRMPEVRVAHPDAPEKFYDVLFQPIREDDGTVDGVLVQSIDITDQVQQRRRVEESENRLRRIIDAIPIGLFFWSETRGIEEMNDALLEILGYTREDLRAGRITRDAFLPPEDRPNDERRIASIFDGEKLAPYEREYLRKDGTRVPVLVGVATTSKKPRTLVAFVLDLSARRRSEEENKKLQAQLLQVQKLESLGVLAGGIAHDFNNLLTAIIGGASAALLMLPKESPAVSAIDSTLLGARRASELTRQLLAYTGKGHFEVRPIDLSSHVRELATLLETTLPKKVQLRLELAGDLPAIEADVAQVQQVVMNLVVNGAEAIGEERGTVLVTTGVQQIDERYLTTLFSADEIAAGRYVFLEVHDTGAGMDDATRARIFDPFFTTKFTGRGLGLAAVLGIVRAHKGALKVYSTPGKGTTFRVFFPASDRATQHEAPDSLDRFQASGVVLVVDDDQGVRRATSMLLQLYGFDVLEAGDGKEGVEVFAKHAHEVRVVILDMTMPELSGEETFRAMRAIRADVPIILASGYNEVEATRRFTAKGLAGFLPKPYTPRELAGRLRAALEGSRT